jgi:flavodoxin
MKTNSVKCLYFSPTGSTQKIVETIAKGTEKPVKASINITTPKQRDKYDGQVDGENG